MDLPPMTRLPGAVPIDFPCVKISQGEDKIRIGFFSRDTGSIGKMSPPLPYARN